MNDSLAQAAMQGLTDGANQIDPLTGAPLQPSATDSTGSSTDTNWWGGVNLTV